MTFLESPSSPRCDNNLDVAALTRIEQRVLWLVTAMVDHANRVRPSR
jgi:hypothetical protein